MTQGPVKFTFDTSFELAPVRRKPAAPVEPTFTAADLAAARDAAFAEGEAAGRAAEAERNEAALARAGDHLAASLAGIAASLAAAEGKLLADAATLGHAVARRLCETLTAQLPLAEMEAMVAACLTELKDEARVVIHVNEGLVDESRRMFEAAANAQAFPGRVIVLASTDLARGDVRVEWAHGGVLRDAAALGRALDAAVNRYATAHRA